MGGGHIYRIIEKERLSDEIVKIEVEAPLVASKAVSGQFVMIRLREGGERIPLTISGCDPERGTITIIFQEVGKTTLDLGRLKPGDSILNLAGPLGRPPELKRFGTVVCVGGGVGIAPVLFRARVLKELGNRIISIIGARSRDMLILKEEMEEVSDRLYVTTDDGSLGQKGFVTDPLRDVLSDEQVDLVVAIGPIGMMKAVSGVAAEFGVKTAVSLNPIMLDGTGMCGSCRVIVGGEVRFACVDGPEFDGGLVDFDALLLRNRRYLEEEEISLKRARGCESHEKAGSSKAYQELR